LVIPATQEATVAIQNERMLAELQTPYPFSQAGSDWIEGETMDFTEETTKAANSLMSEATLGELRELAQDLRALSPDSALAELVEVRIEQILAERGRA
jgi:hypothetical protein